jgi:hypothetical protein
MKLDIDGIRARAEKATPGPWATPREIGDPYEVIVIDHEGCDVWPWYQEDDMIFAYKARTDIPALLDYIDKLEAERAIALRVVDGFKRGNFTDAGYAISDLQTALEKE